MQTDHIIREDFFELKALIIEINESLKRKTSISTEKKWLKGSEVRKLLSISSGTLQNLRISGSLPCRKIGGSFYYKFSDIESLMEGGK